MESPMEHIVRYILIAVSIVGFIVLGMVARSLVRRSLRRLTDKRYLAEPVSKLLQGLAGWIIVIVVILLSLQQLGVHLLGLWAGLLTVAGMVTIGFIAVWSVLSNILCAILLIVFAPFRIGDEIEIIEATGGKGLRGKVVKLNILYTSLQEVTDEGVSDALTHVPNNIFFQKTLRQWQGTDTTSLEASLFESATSEGALAPEKPPSS
jgi:small-conductance mechanosensitive channel